MTPGGKAALGPAEIRRSPATLAATVVATLGLALAAGWTAAPVGAESPGPAATFGGKPNSYTVSLPAGCRHEEGPGTVDAICAPDLDPEKSRLARATGALVLAVAAETLDGAGDTGVAALLERYTEAIFKAELPETVCGEQDKARVKIENLSQSVEGASLVYTADVVCAEIKFLQIATRHAKVRHVIGPDAVYRLVARAPAEVFEKQRPAIDAFFESFRLTPAEKSDK